VILQYSYSGAGALGVLASKSRLSPCDPFQIFGFYYIVDIHLVNWPYIP
jgi:hypothetical protein